MLKGKDIIGRSIIALGSATQISKVQDLIFDHDANQVLAFLVDEGGWFRAAKVVPYAAVRSFGEDAIMVGSADDVISAQDDSRIAELLHTKVSLIGIKLLTTDGRDLGKIADVYFDSLSGKVVGYEATGGLFSDMSSGRTFIPAPETVNVGEHAAIVPPSVAIAMEEQQPGGLQGALRSAGDSLSGAASNVSESVKQGYENLASATKERQQEFVVGKRAGNDVLTDDGSAIAYKGETITATQAELAERKGVLGALVAAATGGSMQAAFDTASNTVQSKVEDLSQASRERQVEYALGKVAGYDVNGANEQLLVRKGEVISPLMVQQAETQDVLSTLAASAAAGDVQAGAQRLGGNLGASFNDGQPSRQAVDASTIIVTPGMPAPSVNPLGRRVKNDVYGEGRTLIAAQGQIVTASVLERARELGREDQLIRATGADVAAVGAPGANISDQLSAGASTVAASAGNLLERARQWLGEKRDEAGEALDQQQDNAEQQRVRDALGRPVTRVILNPDDHIILNIGEIVTNKAVSAAREAGVLDILLDSVSKENVSINPLTVRPQETGEAALEGQGDIHLNKPKL